MFIIFKMIRANFKITRDQYKFRRMKENISLKFKRSNRPIETLTIVISSKYLEIISEAATVVCQNDKF